MQSASLCAIVIPKSAMQSISPVGAGGPVIPRCERAGPVGATVHRARIPVVARLDHGDVRRGRAGAPASRETLDFDRIRPAELRMVSPESVTGICVTGICGRGESGLPLPSNFDRASRLPVVPQSPFAVGGPISASPLIHAENSPGFQAPSQANRDPTPC